MIGIILVTHNGLGDSLVDCVRHVLGHVPPNLKVLPVRADDDPRHKETQGRALITQLGAENGVLLLADVYGATPCNIAQRLQQPGRVKGVAGVNLPMVLRAINYCNMPLAEVVKKVLEGGRECIVLMNTGDQK